MTQRTRILIAVAILVVLLTTVLGVETLRRALSRSSQEAEIMLTAVPGSIPIYVDGVLIDAFAPGDLERLAMVSFVEPEEGKTEEGWLLRDVLLLHMEETALEPDSIIVVSSSSRDKSTELTWAEVADPQNWVMFDLSSRGTLKLVSVLEQLDTRDEWIQDTDRIEISNP